MSVKSNIGLQRNVLSSYITTVRNKSKFQLTCRWQRDDHLKKLLRAEKRRCSSSVHLTGCAAAHARSLQGTVLTTVTVAWFKKLQIIGKTKATSILSLIRCGHEQWERAALP
jgi:hypothetical protein